MKSVSPLTKLANRPYVNIVLYSEYDFKTLSFEFEETDTVSSFIEEIMFKYNNVENYYIGLFRFLPVIPSHDYIIGSMIECPSGYNCSYDEFYKNFKKYVKCKIGVYNVDNIFQLEFSEYEKAQLISHLHIPISK